MPETPVEAAGNVNAEIVAVPPSVPPPANVTAFHVLPVEEKEESPVTVDVPALMVAPISSMLDVVTVELPMLKVAPPDNEIKLEVKALLAVVRVPPNNLTLPVQLNAPASVMVPPEALKSTLVPIVLPLGVIVAVASIDQLAVIDTVIPAEKVMLPKTFMFGLPVSVPVKPVQIKVLQARLPDIVQVTAPDAASKNTSSADVGTAWPPAPPEVNAHLVPAVASHNAVPPTQ